MKYEGNEHALGTEYAGLLCTKHPQWLSSREKLCLEEQLHFANKQRGKVFEKN